MRARTDELPLYVGALEVPQRRPPRVGTPDAMVEPPLVALPAPRRGSALPVHGAGTHGLVIPISRHLVIPPVQALEAFDAWLGTARATRVTTPEGCLRLGEPCPPGVARLRAVPGRLTLRRSFAPLAIELELAAWGAWRCVLTLHPAGRLGEAVSPHRRRRYFAAGHATMQVIVELLGALSARAGAGSYHARPCGPSSSTRTPAPTA